MHSVDAVLALSDSPIVLQTLSQETITVLGVAAIGVLIALSAFFASSEIAIFSLADHRIGSLVEDDVAGAGTLAELKANPRRLLVTILVGNNIANIAMSSIATGLLGMYFGASEAVLIATFGVTSIVLLFGESAPKSYAVENSESWALRISKPLRLSQYLLYPLVAVFDVLTRGVNKIMGSEGDFESAYVTRSEIGDVIQAGQREGVLEEEEHRMLQRILRFRNRTAKETMVPRLDVVAVAADEELSTAIETCIDSEFRRLPVYEGTLDEIVGVVDAIDLLAARERDPDASLRSLAAEPYIVPETKDVDEILEELREQRRNIAIVVDEFGTTAGVLTIENIVEEIIGEVLREMERVPIRFLDDDTALVRGEVNLHEVNETLETDLPETGEFESIAGFIFDRAGRIVEEGESVTYDDVRLVVETAENNRILEVRVEKLADQPPA
ncbi:DNA-binding protein [Natronococcus pandeyae]|uniref:DNA-binding protein n=1 Tax=Natronococcus pandeyae TaxID=2055836 RepID=A0A8J8Q0M1_9EURY|nr:hemolysin family protein [Natronococcus pandeyae]TYL38231.1 DNA-binding protein [Natronococcus pandeyae]